MDINNVTEKGERLREREEDDPLGKFILRFDDDVVAKSRRTFVTNLPPRRTFDESFLRRARKTSRARGKLTRACCPNFPKLFSTPANDTGAAREAEVIFDIYVYYEKSRMNLESRERGSGERT